jgi:hypothetical protein
MAIAKLSEDRESDIPLIAHTVGISPAAGLAVPSSRPLVTRVVPNVASSAL